MKFDVILANPPYDKGLCDKFNSKYFDLCNGEICWVSPSSWLLSKKQNKKITDKIDERYTEITSITGSEYFDAGISGLISIVYVNMKNNEHKIVYDGIEYNKCSEIKKYTNSFLLREFNEIITPLIKKDNMQMHVKRIPNVHAYGGVPEEKYPDVNCYVLRLTRFAVHTDGKHTDNAIISRNYIDNKRFKDYSDLKYYIPCKSENELIRIKNYLRGYFNRAALYLISTSYELGAGELRYVPWFDFSDPIFEETPEEIDIALFEKYNVSQDIINHILEILPNYYDLDLTKYKGQEL